jgi:repressor LexA
MKGITERQTAVLRFINEFNGKYRYPPTVREISDHFIVTPKAAQDHLTALKRKGFIQSECRKPRTLTVLRVP